MLKISDMMSLESRMIKVVLIIFLSKLTVFSQDSHYSQFYNAPQNVNPAWTGVFNGDHRFTGSLRDQWRYVPVPWFTFSGAYDRQLYLKKQDKFFLGVGGIINHDRQGDSRLNLTSLIANGAIHYLINSRNIVSGGLQLGLASRGFNTANLTWDKQWNGDTFDPNLPSAEQFKNLERVTFMESGLGLNYRYQRHSRTYVDAGIAALHIIPQGTAFYSKDGISVPLRTTMALVGNVRLLPQLDLQVSGLIQNQNKYTETVIGGLGKIYLSQKRGKEFQLHLGVGYRTSGSYFPTAAVQYNQFYGSFSYDVDVTGYNDITKSNRGGPELHFRYIITNVKPMREFKNCPIY
jgi:type IX secretion system PorP/SprF family membrane protein